MVAFRIVGLNALAGAMLFLLASAPANALVITGYSSTANDRFSSGYPVTPVESTAPSFIGLGLDWSGVGWNSADATKSFGFLSPAHYLVARHYGGGANIQVFAGGTVQTYGQYGTEDIGLGVVFQGQTLGDISLGTLTGPAPAPSTLPRYAVLDLNGASATNSTSAYNGLSTLIYGRGPDASFSTRIGQTTISSVEISGNDHYFTTTRSDVQLEAGDSGSPVFHGWTNPNGGKELTLLGNNAGINTITNFLNFLGSYQVMNELNTRMNDDGFALRVVGDPTNTWVGSSSTSIGSKGAWGLGPRPSQAPSDKFVTFDAATAGNNRQVTVDDSHNLRGLYFRSTATAADGFTFGGISTLTIGRGGVTNYDNSRQLFNAPLLLGDAQYWDGGSGGITAGAINTDGNLLEMAGLGANRITGVVSGVGGLTVSGGILELSGANTYSGTTTVANGTLSASSIVVSAGASNLGNATSAVVLGSVTTGGTLSYTGPSATFVRGFSINAGGGELDTVTAGQTLTINTGAITSGSSSTLTIGGAGNTTITAVVNLGGTSGALIKKDAGLLNINSGAQTYKTLTTIAGAGTTNVNVALTITGGTDVVVNAKLRFGSVSQTLSSLTIGAGATVVFTSGMASGSLAEPGFKSAGVEGISPAPEPGTLGLLLVGALGVLNRRRRITA